MHTYSYYPGTEYMYMIVCFMIMQVYNCLSCMYSVKREG